MPQFSRVRRPALSGSFDLVKLFTHSICWFWNSAARGRTVRVCVCVYNMYSDLAHLETVQCQTLGVRERQKKEGKERHIERETERER